MNEQIKAGKGEEKLGITELVDKVARDHDFVDTPEFSKPIQTIREAVGKKHRPQQQRRGEREELHQHL